MDSKAGAIAVITVHGVGSPTPGAMGQEIAGLLQRTTGAYTEFKESLFELKVEEVRPQKPGQADGTVPPSAGRKVPWYIRTRMVSGRAAEQEGAGPSPGAESAPDIVFTREAVQGAVVDDSLIQYRSLVLGGERKAGGAASQAVDIYEMYWADLSRLGGWIGKVLGEFYQILFHAANIGQKTVELAWLRSDAGDRRLLTPVLACQAVAEGMLAIAMPLFNLALALAILPMTLVFVTNPAIQAALCGAIVSCVAGYLFCRETWRTRVTDSSDHDVSGVRGTALLVLVAVGLALGCAVGYLAYQWGTAVTRMLLFVMFSAGMLAVYVAAARALLRRRKKKSLPPRIVNRIAIVSWVLLLLAALYRFPMTGDKDEVRIATFIAEGMFLAIGAAWVAFIAAGLLSCAFGFRAIRGTQDERTKAAIWTGKIGLFVPAALFYVVNIVAWHAVYDLAFVRMKATLDVGYTLSLLKGTAFESWQKISCVGADTATTAACAKRMLETGSGPAFSVFIVILALAIGLMLVALLPSIVYESSPRWRSTPQASAALGNWLDAGWVVLRGAGYLFVGGLLLAVPALQLTEIVHGTAFLNRFGLGEDALLTWLGGGVVGGAGLAVAFREALSKGLTRAVGILFDVDNWLKERPIDRNPRGRILLRYMALLRHIRKAGYKRIVIVSHSQGTVITADLLRFLYIHPEHVGATRQDVANIRLMTFGSPLRQLYGLRFPDLYGWARERSVRENGRVRLPISDRYPDRTALFGVERWINAYRSGDYVGRFFWTPEKQWLPAHAPADTPTAEFCLSTGAHTHYFDNSALNVGEAIDREIADPGVPSSSRVAGPAPVTDAGLKVPEPAEEKKLG